MLQICFKCCGALDYAFREGIVHRDIKPANIMIASGTDVKIADFGAALLRKTQTVQTVAIGSPFYMSPEQIEDKPLTHHSDMFSLGVVLYELLTGQRPFAADSLEGLVQKILQQDPAPPSTLRDGVPREIDRIVMQALGKKPEHRYATWAEFALQLAHAVQAGAAGRGDIGQREVPGAEEASRCSPTCPIRSCGNWRAPDAGPGCRASRPSFRENEPGQSFFFLAQGEVKVTRQGRLLNMIDKKEFFGEMAYIRGGELPRHATVESMTELLLAEFDPDALSRMTLGAQLQLTRTLVRNLVDRLELANERLAR